MTIKIGMHAGPQDLSIEDLKSLWRIADENNRPARETVVKTEGMYGGRLFEVSLMAVLS